MNRLLDYFLSPSLASVLLFSTSIVFAGTAPPDFRQKQSDEIWEQSLRKPNFQDRVIIQDDKKNVLQVKAPHAAEDATIVPVSIHTFLPQTAEKYIEKIHLFVDQNPLPLVGIFDFSPESGKADLALRIRVDTFSYVRAVAELNTGELYMAKSFVRAKGACSAPPPASIEDSRRLVGKMKVKTLGDLNFGEPNLVQLKIRHPNITGMAPLRIGSRVIPPAYYLKDIEVLYNDAPIMKALLTFSVSMDPAFRFFFTPEEPGVITIKGTDTKNKEFEYSYEISKV